jgi:hypothetical protein
MPSDFLDITGANFVHIQIREDGKVIWVNVDDSCRLRICRIDGPVEILDERKEPQP